MDFSWSEEDRRFRQEIHDYIASLLPPDWSQKADFIEEEDAGQEFEKFFARKLGEKHWLAVGWPKEYGGMGWTPIQQLIFMEELHSLRAPRSFIAPGIFQVGPILLVHGTDEQKEQFVRPTGRGELRWCTLFSEPGAGSDLASLKIKAEDKGDYFLLNGQKIWTTRGHKAEHGILLARTDETAPKHKGISLFVVDMNWPGVKIQPIINLANVHSFNAVFFDNVKVPRSRLVGKQNMGWYVVSTFLNMERSGIKFHAPAAYMFNEILDFVKQPEATGFCGDTPVMRHRIADMAIQMQVSRLLCYRVAWLQTIGAPPRYEASLSKLFSTELTQRVTELGMEVLGLHSQLTPQSYRRLLNGKIERRHLIARQETLGGGTSEVQRNIIAQSGLGLPR